MFVINEDKSIYLTRGDNCVIKVSALNSEGEIETLPAKTVVRFKVYEKKDCGCVMLQKDIEVQTETTEVKIPLTRDETKIGELISKPKDYCYEVELDPDTAPRTIIGYDEDGAKIFRLFPEGGDE